MTQLLLIRHAANDWLGRKLPGRLPGLHLNEEGRRQAQALGERLADVPPAAIYSSPLERALETAEALAQRHNLPVVTREGLLEVDAGEWAGKEFEELRRMDSWKTLRVNPASVAIPGGEAIHQAQARVIAEIERISKEHPKDTVAVVSHADPIKLALAHYLGLGLDNYHRLLVDPASLTVLWIIEEGAFLARLNDTGPLKLHRD